MSAGVQGVESEAAMPKLSRFLSFSKKQHAKPRPSRLSSFRKMSSRVFNLGRRLSTDQLETKEEQNSYQNIQSGDSLKSFDICDEETGLPIQDIPRMQRYQSSSAKESRQNLKSLFDDTCTQVEHLRLVVQEPVVRELPEELNMEDFQDLERVGSGDTAVVYEAKWRGDGPVSLKIMNEASCDSDDDVLDFLASFELLKRIDHPNIVRVFGLGSMYRANRKHPQLFMVQESMSNGTLSEMLREVSDEQRSLPLLERTQMEYLKVLEIAYAIANALEYLHSLFLVNGSVIVRDLQPDNIMIDGECDDLNPFAGRVKLVDLGSCICVRKSEKASQKYALSGFQTNLRYMAPEVTEDDAMYNESVDVYAWAMILWQMCALELPYGSELTDDNFKARVVDQGERPPLPPSWPEGLRSLLQQCWHAEPFIRPKWPYIHTHIHTLVLDLATCKADNVLEVSAVFEDSETVKTCNECSCLTM